MSVLAVLDFTQEAHAPAKLVKGSPRADASDSAAATWDLDLVFELDEAAVEALEGIFPGLADEFARVRDGLGSGKREWKPANRDIELELKNEQGKRVLDCKAEVRGLYPRLREKARVMVARVRCFTVTERHSGLIAVHLDKPVTVYVSNVAQASLDFGPKAGKVCAGQGPAGDVYGLYRWPLEAGGHLLDNFGAKCPATQVVSHLKVDIPAALLDRYRDEVTGCDGRPSWQFLIQALAQCADDPEVCFDNDTRWRLTDAVVDLAVKLTLEAGISSTTDAQGAQAQGAGPVEA